MLVSPPYELWLAACVSVFVAPRQRLGGFQKASKRVPRFFRKVPRFPEGSPASKVRVSLGVPPRPEPPRPGGARPAAAPFPWPGGGGVVPPPSAKESVKALHAPRTARAPPAAESPG